MPSSSTSSSSSLGPGHCIFRWGEDHKWHIVEDRCNHGYEATPPTMPNPQVGQTYPGLCEEETLESPPTDS